MELTRSEDVDQHEGIGYNQDAELRFDRHHGSLPMVLVAISSKGGVLGKDIACSLMACTQIDGAGGVATSLCWRFGSNTASSQERGMFGRCDELMAKIEASESNKIVRKSLLFARLAIRARCCHMLSYARLKQPADSRR